jgi:hypothetical protein
LVDLLQNVLSKSHHYFSTVKIYNISACGSAFDLQKFWKKMIDGFIFQLQENTARRLKRELSRITKDFTSQVHSLEEKISQVTSEKVCETQDSSVSHM